MKEFNRKVCIFYGSVAAPQLQSNASTGTPPMSITSTTLVSNLNADLLDGNHASAFASSSTVSNTSTTGLLTSTDWNTFNGKQNELGFTPYNSTNPSGYISGINSSMVTSALGYTPKPTFTENSAFNRIFFLQRHHRFQHALLLVCKIVFAYYLIIAIK